MALAYYISVFFCLACCVSADDWDDFANNLATDLAPLITLFGEQITRQCMSELISTLDDFIFALAPLGVLTAVVSVIRVCGNSTLRAIIGRAQEDPASSEKEILSCVSDSTAEIFTESGVARITGNPKILEIVADESQAQSGVVTIRRVSEVAGKAWTDLEKDAKLPNLSLNKGIRRRAPFWFHLAATFGVALQLSIIIYAALTVMYWPQAFLKNGGPVDSYAFPMFVLGTTLLTLGMFLCAVLIERHSKKHIFTLPEENRVYWIQPGNQTVGDQKFPSFVGRTDKGVYFIRSVRDQSPNDVLNVGRGMELMFVVCLTMTGFVIQFVGIRGLHSSVILAQLGATMVMTLVRTGLRAERMKEGDNMLKDDQDIVSSGEHELDWLAFRLFNVKSFRVLSTASVQGSRMQSDPMNSEPIMTREKLRKLAGKDWDETRARRMAQNLGRAAMELLHLIPRWCDKEVPFFDIVIPIEIQKNGDLQPISYNWMIRLIAGKEVDTDFWEAILALYVWSLKQSNRDLVDRSRTRFFRTFSPKAFTSHQARLLYRAWTNDRLPIHETQSASKYYLSECRTFGHLDIRTNNKVEDDTATIAVSSDIYTLVAQDVYMHMIHSAIEPLSDIGSKTHITGSDKSSYRLSNPHVEALATAFYRADLGDHKESLACILPVFADRSLLPAISTGLPSVRQSMEDFVTKRDFHNLIIMSEWLCSLADHDEVQHSIVEYAHLCLNILLNPDLAIQELAVERITAMIDVTDSEQQLSHTISKHLDISSVPSENWRCKFRAEIAWMVSQIIRSLTSQTPDKRILNLLQKLETKVGSRSALPETYHDLQAAVSSEIAFFALWFGSNMRYSDLSSESSQAALDWLIHNQFTVLLEVLIIQMVNNFSATDRLLEVIIYTAQKDYTEAIPILLHHMERTQRRHDIICELSRRGELETLKAFLGKGGSFSIITSDHESSFLIAAQAEHHLLLNFLLEGGVNVDLQDSNGETALMKAATNGDIPSAELLLSFNASLNQQDNSGQTALIYAAKNGHLNVIEILISKGADVNLPGLGGRTALMAAASRREMPILRYICEHNADVNITDLDKYSVLDVAEQEGFTGRWVEGCAYLEALGAKHSNTVHYPGLTV